MDAINRCDPNTGRKTPGIGMMIYSFEAPHINEARDKKMDELDNLMSTNEKKVRNALRNLSRLTDRPGGIVMNDALSAFSKFMEVHEEVLRLSRMNTNIKSLELSLGRKREVAIQCEEILNSLQDAVQGRSFKPHGSMAMMPESPISFIDHRPCFG
jgi:hypothetical protein